MLCKQAVWGSYASAPFWNGDAHGTGWSWVLRSSVLGQGKGDSGKI